MADHVSAREVTAAPVADGAGSFDPDELARVEEQRAFLRRSLDDLDRELAAGDLDAADHAALADDYRRRLAEVDDEVARGRSAIPASRPASRGRLLVVIAVVAVVAVGAGVAVAATSGGRKPGDTITGNVPRTTEQLLTEAARLAFDERYTDALELYDEVLGTNPENVEALAERGFLLVTLGMGAQRPILVEQGRISIEEALRVEPGEPRTLFYLALALRLSGEDAGAQQALTDALASNPSPELRAEILNLQSFLASQATTTTTATTTTGR